MHRSTPNPSGFGHLLLIASILGIAGCFSTSAPQAKPPSPPTEAKNRPPLQVLLVDLDIGEPLSRQWQAYSEQPIQFETIRSEELATRALDSTDVWIYPNQNMGDLIEGEKILPLPPSAFGVALGENNLEESHSTEVEKGKGSIPDSWPIRWRSVSRFGTSYYGLPLGAPQLVLASRNIPLDMFDGLDETKAAVDDRDTIAAKAWSEVLSDENLKASPRPTVLTDGLRSLTAEQRDAIVDRFLWIVATSNAKRRGLFEMTRLKPRLASSEFISAAEVLTKLAERFPETMLATHSEAWEQLELAESEKQTLAIAFPAIAGKEAGKDLRSDARESGTESIRFSKLTFNPFQGLSASVGRKTRQTSVAAQFVAWLSAAEQRDSLARLSDRVERWPSQPSPEQANVDYRAYQNLTNREYRAESLVLSTRFANFQSYRAALAESLVQILATPDRKQAILEDCVKKWNAITESVGIMKQRKTVELSMGFGS